MQEEAKREVFPSPWHSAQIPIGYDLPVIHRTVVSSFGRNRNQAKHSYCLTYDGELNSSSLVL